MSLNTEAISETKTKHFLQISYYKDSLICRVKELVSLSK